MIDLEPAAPERLLYDALPRGGLLGCLGWVGRQRVVTEVADHDDVAAVVNGEFPWRDGRVCGRQHDLSVGPPRGIRKGTLRS